jgi:uncharacterized protein (DUF58 family)
MLTTRAWWFLVAVTLLLVVGLLRPLLPLTMTGLALLLWFGGQWLLFAVRLPGLRSVQLEREIRDEQGPVNTLWAGQGFEVRVRLVWHEKLDLPFAAVTDPVPFGVEQESGLSEVQGELNREEPLELGYRMRCPTAGVARFEGVRIQVADLQGFFYHVHFVHAPRVLRILPVLVQRGGQPASKKRHNLLIPPGIHRFRRPGSGSELLDLRDYLPGDPPKTIAWKVSARRDRLITKEFESEVPVRCTLFVDTSNSVRVPGLVSSGHQPATYGKALDRLVHLAAGILQASASIRDLTGLCLFDEQGVTSVRPDRSGRHLTQMLHMLAEAAALMPRQERIKPEHLLPLAFSFAREVYPDQMSPDINSMPLWLRWVSGFSGYSRRRLRLFDWLHRRKHELVVVSWWLSFWALFLPPGMILTGRLFGSRALDEAGVIAFAVATFASLMLWYTTLMVFGSDALFGWGKRRRDRWRKQLAALLSVEYGLIPGGVSALLEDDDAFALLVQRFLADHRVPYLLPLYDRAGRYQFAAPGKVQVLSGALVSAVGKGHDNELFVLLADLLELDDQLEPLLRAVGVALSRHHQVILICPWPPGLDLPRDNPSRQAAASLAVHGRPTPPSEPALPSRPERVALWDQTATTLRFQAAYHRLRRTFARLGVPVLCAAGDEPVPLILTRLERLRTLGRPHS